MFDSAPPIRMEHQPSIGASLVFHRNEPRPEEPVLVHPRALLDGDTGGGDPALLAILAELQGLRADLASRTLAARTRRLWTWLKGVARRAVQM